nr:EOG090X0H1B [Eurycercus lamellatus]
MQTDEEAVQITSARNAKTLSPAHLKQCILAESRFDFLKDLVMAVPDVQGDGEEGVVSAASVPSTPTGTAPHHQHPPIFRSQSEAASSSSSVSGRKVGGTGRPRGRPRKNPVVSFQQQQPTAQRSRIRPAAARKSATDSDEETDSNGNESEEDEDEDNSTDEEPLSSRKAFRARSTATLNGGSGGGTAPLIAATTTTPSSTTIPTISDAQHLNPQVQFNAVRPNFYQEISSNSGSSSSTQQQQQQQEPPNPSIQIQINLPASESSNGLPGANNDDDDDYDT